MNTSPLNTFHVLTLAASVWMLTCCNGLGNNPFNATIDGNVNINPNQVGPSSNNTGGSGSAGSSGSANNGNATNNANNMVTTSTGASLCNANSPFPVCLGFENSPAGMQPNFPVNAATGNDATIGLLQLSNLNNVLPPQMVIDGNTAYRGNNSLRISYAPTSINNPNNASMEINSMGMLLIPYQLVNPGIALLTNNNQAISLYGRMFIKSSNSVGSHTNANLLNEAEVYTYMNLHTNIPVVDSTVKNFQVRFGGLYDANMQGGICNQYFSGAATGSDRIYLQPDPNSLSNPTFTVQQDYAASPMMYNTDANLSLTMQSQWTCVEWTIQAGTNANLSSGATYTYQFYINGNLVSSISQLTNPPNTVLSSNETSTQGAVWIGNGQTAVPGDTWIGLNNQTTLQAPTTAGQALGQSNVWIDEIALSANQRIGCSN